MKRLALLSTLILAITAAIKAQDASTAVNGFAFDMYRSLAIGKNINFVFSPLSIEPTFGMVALGAKGATSRQLNRVFRFQNDSEFHAELGKLLQNMTLQSDHSVDITITNRMWVDESYRIKRRFTRKLRRSYHAKPARLNFIGRSNDSRLTINRAIEQDTHGKIKNLLPEGSLDEMTRLVLTNAVFFKGKWEIPFKPNDTKTDEFYITPEKPIKHPFMFSKNRFGYLNDSDFSALELDYSGKKYSLLIILPHEGRALTKIEKQLDIELYNRIITNLKPQKVAVYLPKFKVETGLSLKQILSEMGMPVAFSNLADFSGISGRNNLKLSDAFHKAFIEVSEEGTTAAAATAVVVAMKSLPKPCPVFKANRPFLYIIREKQNNTILFMGRVQKPTL